jgi:hypothetical protein
MAAVCSFSLIADVAADVELLLRLLCLHYGTTHGVGGCPADVRGILTAGCVPG